VKVMRTRMPLHRAEGKLRVLVVEDEPEMRTMLRDGLREHGHAVAVASDGQDGLSLATEPCAPRRHRKRGRSS